MSTSREPLMAGGNAPRANIRKPLAIIGYVLVAAGLLVVVLGALPSEGDYSLTVQPGGNRIDCVEVSTWTVGHLSGSYEVYRNVSVNFLIFDSSEYNELMKSDWSRMTQRQIAMFSEYYSFGRTGLFSVNLTGASSHYMMVTAFSTSNVTVSIHFEIEGLDLRFLIGGTIVLSSGVACIVASARMKRTEMEAQQTR